MINVNDHNLASVKKIKCIHINVISRLNLVVNFNDHNLTIVHKMYVHSDAFSIRKNKDQLFLISFIPFLVVVV